MSGAPAPSGAVTVEFSGRGKFQMAAHTDEAAIIVDEPKAAGGLGEGMTPYDLILAALGSCTAMTLRLYADRKAIPLEDVRIVLSHDRVHARDCEDCETVAGFLDVIRREIELVGPLDESQRARLLEIADLCPVHRTLTGEIKVRTTLKAG